MADGLMEYVLSYGRFEDDEPPELIQGLTDAAVAYLDGAGVTEELSPAALYKLAVGGIVLDWHDKRGPADAADPKDFSTGTRLVINQLKSICKLVSKLDTSN